MVVVQWIQARTLSDEEAALRQIDTESSDEEEMEDKLNECDESSDGSNTDDEDQRMGGNFENKFSALISGTEA